MEKGEYKTGQLLGIVEKRGKLVREYVAGFFGEEPIIKQRLLTPQEARRYREDKERGVSQGKTGSEAARAAGQVKPGGALGGASRLKKRPVKPGEMVRKRPISARGDQPDETGDESAVQARPQKSEAQTAKSAPETNYGSQHTSVNDTFIQQLIDKETEKPNFNPANRQKALTAINRIGCPEMKVFQLGTMQNGKEGYCYSQKEYMARNILGLPIWQAKSEEPEKKEEAEAPVEETAAVVETEEETALVTGEEADTDAKFDA